MKFHPFCEAFPLIEGEAFDELVADIKAHGLREEIWTYGGMILDGRNRFRACQKANEKPRFRAFIGNDEAAITLVKSANVHRRHLTASQRALAFAELAKWANEGRPKNSAPGAEFSTVREVADEAHVSDRTMHQAKAVADKGSKKLKESVRAGDVSIKKAAAVVDLPKSEQLAAATAKTAAASNDEPERPDDGEDAESLEAAEHAWRVRLDKVLAADDKLSEMSRQLKEIQGLYEYEKREHNRYMNENAALIRRNKSLQQKLDRLEKKAA